MRFPFFKNAKEDVKTNIRIPVPVRHASGSLAETQPLQPSAGRGATPQLFDPNAPAIRLSVASLVPQLPQQLFTEAGRSQLSSISIALPAGLVLPQLSTGKVAIKLDDLLPHFPASALRSPLPPVSDQQTVVLPLHEVIASVPPELLTVEHDSEIRADDPELEKLPKLVDEAMLTPEPAPETEPAAPEPSLIVVPPKPKTTGAPEYVMVSLRALVAVMPESVFCCPRAQLATKVNLDTPVLLPTEPILPQLRSASVKLPLSIVLAVMPHQILASPMPALDGQLIPLPLVEIIPQLPRNVFTDSLREPSEESEAATMEIPDPFQEKSAPAELPAEPIAGELAVDEAALEDDSFSVFAERAPAAAPEPVEETPAVIEPVAEEPVVAEPVVEEPQPEPVVAEVSQPEPQPEPVAEEVLPEPAGEPAAFDERKLLIDLNRCTVEDLTMIPGIGRALAQRIVDFRNARGHFQSVEELRQVPGIGRKTFRALAGVQPRALNRLLGAPHDGELTLQEIVRLTSKLPGIEGCMLASSDGLFLTGELPARLDQATISVFAPQLFKKVGRYARELKVGSIRRFTIFTDTQPISIFRAGDVYLIVIHDAFRFSKALLRRCERISQEIARLSSQRVTV